MRISTCTARRAHGLPSSSSCRCCLVAQLRLPAAAIPPPPAIVDVWVWSLSPGQDRAFATGDSPLSIAAEVVLAGEYSVRSEGRLQVQRATGFEEVAPGTVVTVHPGEAVIYVEN